MLKVVSYYRECGPNDHFTLWCEGMGVSLPDKLGKVVYGILYNDISVINGHYDIIEENFDIAYCQLFVIPKKRPAPFIYSFISDYINNENKVRNWIIKVRPNLLCSLQYINDDFIEFGKKYGCEIRLVPWFVLTKEPYIDKTIEGMCTGCISARIYPSRKKIFEFLTVKQRKDILLSCSGNFGHYPLSNQEYRKNISKTKYYFSGGIYDKLIPPKYYEVCNCGACLVSFDMPKMKKCGFIDGETYIKLNSIKDINKILDTDKYIEIGKAAQKMIHERHTVDSRVKEILEVYYDYRQTCFK